MTEDVLDTIINNLAGKTPDFFFVQIGACDGVVSDPINKFIKKYGNWRGILIEPQKKEFENLKKTYAGRDFIFENIAIGDKKETKKLYKPKEELIADERWKRGIATFFPEKNLMKQYLVNNEYETEIVECYTFENITKKHNVRKIDLLQIDTEGYDYVIMKSINFNEIKPKIVHFEHLILTDGEKEECSDLLKKEDYFIFRRDRDTLAFLKKYFMGYLLPKKLSAIKNIISSL